MTNEKEVINKKNYFGWNLYIMEGSFGKWYKNFNWRLNLGYNKSYIKEKCVIFLIYYSIIIKKKGFLRFFFFFVFELQISEVIFIGVVAN